MLLSTENHPDESGSPGCEALGVRLTVPVPSAHTHPLDLGKHRFRGKGFQDGDYRAFSQVGSLSQSVALCVSVQGSECEVTLTGLNNPNRICHRCEWNLPLDGDMPILP